jgi:allantoinase
MVVEDGKIAAIEAHDVRADVDVGDLAVSAGIVDTHVHVNEPGRTEWEGFETATRAAAAGGVTTIVDMPLNSVPATTTVDALYRKRKAAAGQCHVDVAFWGGIVPGNEGEIPRLVDEGVRGFKCFLAPSGVDEFPCVGEADLRCAMPWLSRGNAQHRALLVHAEDPAHLREPHGDRSKYETFLASRPVDAEVHAIRVIAALAAEYGRSAHIVHVSSADGVAEIARTRQTGGPYLTGETCPHYLTFAAEEIPDGATEFKCAPPIRTGWHRERLWSGLRGRVDATLSVVASDHSPAPPEMKQPGDFVGAWGGISSLELSLPAVWTGASSRGFSLSDLTRWLSWGPADLAHLSAKGLLRVGADADLVVWDPDDAWTVDPSRLRQRHKLTPYAGRTLRGVVHATYLRGACVYRDGEIIGSPRGAVL